MKIALAQIDFMVGDIQGNCDKIIAAATQAQQSGADMVVYSELALTGYPPEDLLLRPDLYSLCAKALQTIKEQVKEVALVVGFPEPVEVGNNSRLYNACGVFYQGEQIAHYRKQCLPNYAVFDEKRYFATGEQTCVFTFKGTRIGLVICEDLWHAGPVAACRATGAELIVAPNASPFHYRQSYLRQSCLQQRVKECALPIVYVNQVGGQDELVFDGESLVIDGEGVLQYRGPSFAESLDFVHFEKGQIKSKLALPELVVDEGIDLPKIYQALKLGVKDYVNKNGFQSVILGLSGGIDSALTLAIATDALGADKVMAVMMPFQYTSQMSVEDAREEAERLGVEFDIISIEPIFNAFMQQLKPQLGDREPDTTEQNLQARCRGTLLMALSNARNALVLTTGNKSEVAVGYATLYGDMAGGLDVLKDVPKTLVYQLARYRNTLSPVIPERVITRPPSAELAPDQKDEDNLPDYPTLDAILKAYVEEDRSVEDIVAMGYARETVQKVINLVDLNEHKRRQAAPGIRITPRAFGRDRRYPITNAYRKQILPR